MPRPDLLALTEDDLSLLSNRGIVKRARREAESGEFKALISEAQNGDITFEWSDAATVVIYADRRLADAKCSVPTAGLGRHVIRSVFAYQRHCADSRGVTPGTQTAPTDFGALDDAALQAASSPQTLTRAQALLKDGQPVVLRRGEKATAHFPLLSLAVRYAVAGDLRHTTCECAEAQPCLHAVAGALAFRLLAPDLQSGLVFAKDVAPAPPAALSGIDGLVAALLDFGFATIPSPLLDRFRREGDALERTGLPWLAEILADLVEEYDRYTAHDSRFDPLRVAELLAELIIRADAARAPGNLLPRAFTVGLRQAFAAAESSGAQYVGLGTEAHNRKGAAELVTYLQHRATGSILYIEKSWKNPEPDPANPTPLPTFARLGISTLLKGITWHSLGSSTMTLKGGKRSASGRLILGKTPAVALPDGLRWEKLRPNILAEDFNDALTRLASMPPAALAPRRRAEDILVLPVSAVEDTHFAIREHAIIATLRDANGTPATLFHPWTTRAAHGSAALLQRLAAEAPKWISAHTRVVKGRLELRPIALVFEDNAGKRTLLQPWIDELPSPLPSALDFGKLPHSGEGSSPLHQLAEDVLEAFGDLLVLGLRQAGLHTSAEWKRLAAHAERIGLAQFPRSLQAAAEAIESAIAHSRRDSQPATSALLLAAVQALFLRT